MYILYCEIFRWRNVVEQLNWLYKSLEFFSFVKIFAMSCMAVKRLEAKAVELAFPDFQMGYVGVITAFKSTSKRWPCDC